MRILRARGMINAAATMRTEALWQAKAAVKDRLRAQHRRVHDYQAAEISRLARAWFEDHKAELLDQALRNILRRRLNAMRAVAH